MKKLIATLTLTVALLLGVFAAQAVAQVYYVQWYRTIVYTSPVMQGLDVQRVQEDLNFIRCYGKDMYGRQINYITPSGAYGYSTMDSVRLFQYRSAARVTGKVGAKTYAYIRYARESLQVQGFVTYFKYAGD